MIVAYGLGFVIKILIIKVLFGCLLEVFNSFLLKSSCLKPDKGLPFLELFHLTDFPLATFRWQLS